MTALIIITIILASFILADKLIIPFIIGLVISKKLAKKHLIRGKDGWPRGKCSDETNYEQMLMWNAGLAWAEENKKYKDEVDVISDGYHLYGEYFNFGYKKAVIIVPGRTETVHYSYFYAKPYQNLGFNVLVIDKRAHGLSEGEYEDGGQYSHVDLFAWANLLKEKYGIEDVTLHGICLGCSTIVFATATEKCPSNIKRIVVDGMFTTFYETYRNHMIAEQRPTFPYALMVMWWLKKFTKADFLHNGPIKQISKVNLPILFIYTTLDKFSTPEQAKILYDRCPSIKKELVFFDKGGHSHILFNNPEKYELTIKEFMNNNP